MSNGSGGGKWGPEGGRRIYAPGDVEVTVAGVPLVASRGLEGLGCAPSAAPISSEADALQRFGTVSVALDFMQRAIWFGMHPVGVGHPHDRPGVACNCEPATLHLGLWLAFVPDLYADAAREAAREAIEGPMFARMTATKERIARLIRAIHVGLLGRLGPHDRGGDRG